MLGVLIAEASHEVLFPLFQEQVLLIFVQNHPRELFFVPLSEIR